MRERISAKIRFILCPPKVYKIKSATTEAAAQKTQTPIVAKLTVCETGASHIHIVGICIFIQCETMGWENKRIFSYKKKKYTRFHICSVSLALSL